jgi:hypothetical protein
MTDPDANPNESWSRFVHPNRAFSLEHPSCWSLQDHGHFATIGPPGDENGPCLAISCFQRPKSSLSEFATQRFRVESDIYNATSSVSELSGATWVGLAQESEGRDPGDPEPTVRYMVCAHSEPLFVSLTLYASPSDFRSRRAHYDRIFQSLTFSNGGPRPAGWLNKLKALFSTPQRTA